MIDQTKDKHQRMGPRKEQGQGQKQRLDQNKNQNHKKHNKTQGS